MAQDPRRSTIADLIALASFGTCVVVAACTAAQLAGAGVSPSASPTVAIVTQDLAAAGQLYCAANGQIYQAGSVSVINATSSTVAKACAALQIGQAAIAGAVPVPAAPGTQVLVAAVAPAAAAAVAASVP